MEFKTKAQEECYNKITPMIKELFGEMAYVREDTPGFMLAMGSAYAHIIVYAWGENNSMVMTRAYVVSGAEIKEDLMRYLLNENGTMNFGAFGMNSDNDIFFDHTIVGSSCDKSELKASIMAVMNTADNYDDQIVARWGGQRAMDKRG